MFIPLTADERKDNSFKKNFAPDFWRVFSFDNVIDNIVTSPQFIYIQTRGAATALRKNKCYEPEPKFAWQN
jgi:hypothetical protein